MDEDRTKQLEQVAIIIVGILILVYPALVSYIIGLFLIIYGALNIIR